MSIKLSWKGTFKEYSQSHSLSYVDLDCTQHGWFDMVGLTWHGWFDMVCDYKNLSQVSTFQDT